MKKDKVPKVKGTNQKITSNSSSAFNKPPKRPRNGCSSFDKDNDLPVGASTMIIDSSQGSNNDQKFQAVPDATNKDHSMLNSHTDASQNLRAAIGKSAISDSRDSNKCMNLDKFSKETQNKCTEEGQLIKIEKQNEITELTQKNKQSHFSNRTSSNQHQNRQIQNIGNQNINPNIMVTNYQKGSNAEIKPSSGYLSTKKRTYDKMSNSVGVSLQTGSLNNLSSPNSQRGAPKNEQNLENQLIAMYRQNFCPCTQPVCKESLSNKLKQLLKKNETFTQMQSLLYGCPRTNSQEVQLTLLDDIDRCMSLISECNQFKGLGDNSGFSFTLIFFELFKFQNCWKMEQKNLDQEQPSSDQPKIPCSVMNLIKIKERCKRYDPNHIRSKNKIKTTVQIKCEQHGDFDQQAATFHCKSARKFISFTCFLIQFKFKLLNIEDISQTEKDRQRREMTNIIKCMIQECHPQLYYYPMRALQEFYFQEVSEKSLGKRLSCESLLQYKLKKERQGRKNLLTDFKKLSLISKQSSHSYQHHQYQTYLLIYHDTIKLIRQVIGECEYNCNIVCLKILQQLSKIQQAATDAGYIFNSGEFCSKQQLINFKVECLQAMAQKGSLSQLCDKEKQMFYEEVKQLILQVKQGWAQREAIAIKKRQDRRLLKMNQMYGHQTIEDSDSDQLDNTKRSSTCYDQKSVQNFIPQDRVNSLNYQNKESSQYYLSLTQQSRQNNQNMYQSIQGKSQVALQAISRSRSFSNWQNNDSLREECLKHDCKVVSTNNFDLSILEPFLTIETINQFPKLSLLVFQAIRPIMPIFMNNYIQILEKFERSQLLKFDYLDKQVTQENFDQSISDSKLKKFNCSGRRENLITTWMSGQKYRSELERRMTQIIQMQNNCINTINGQQVPHGQKGQVLQLAEHQTEIKKLCRLRRQFTSNEIVFVFDFLLVMCKHAVYRKDPIAVSIATHLIQDFHYKTQYIFKNIILANNTITSELLALNFEIRSKKFIEEQNIQNKLMIEDETPKDELFTKLFDKVFQLIKNPNLQPMVAESFDFNRTRGKQAGMSSYTSTFFKQIIRIFQTSRKFLNIDYVKPLIDQLITGNSSLEQQNDHQLLVIVNSLPLYLAIQMFFDPNQIGLPSGHCKEMVESNDGGLSYKVWEVMKIEIEKIKNKVQQGTQIDNPMLIMQRISNLIHSSTSILQYLLCFQTPLVDKSSSSQIHSNNSQNQFNMSPIQIKNSQNQSQKTLGGLNQLPHIGTQQLNALAPQNASSSNSFNLSLLSSQLQQQLQINQLRKSMQKNPRINQVLGSNGSQINNQNDPAGITGQNNELFENTFLIKRQKYCNFCSSQVPLPHPTSFTFSRKCANCSMKNSCLLMPARFLCNMCIDHNFNDLYRCEREEIPLEGVRDAPVLHSTAQVRVIQKVVKEALFIWHQDIQNQRLGQSFWESSQIGCVDKCCEQKYMYSNILKMMTNRMLKLMLWILKHRLQPEADLLRQFHEIEDMEQKLTIGFQQIKYRIMLIKKELIKINLEDNSKGKLL